jgi:hypothetical protein
MDSTFVLRVHYFVFYVRSAHSRAALTPRTVHWTLLGAAQSLHGEHLPFSKFFRKKIIKKVHFFRFGAVLRVRIVIIRNGQGL